MVLLKPNGDIRLCVDMQQVNEAVVMECHLIHTIDEVLHELVMSKVFQVALEVRVPPVIIACRVKECDDVRYTVDCTGIRGCYLMSMQHPKFTNMRSAR